MDITVSAGGVLKNFFGLGPWGPSPNHYWAHPPNSYFGVAHIKRGGLLGILLLGLNKKSLTPLCSLLEKTRPFLGYFMWGEKF